MLRDNVDFFIENRGSLVREYGGRLLVIKDRTANPLMQPVRQPF